MQKLITVKLPLFVHTTKAQTTKGKAIFNLNNYRNWYYQKSNQAKIAMKEYIKKCYVPYLGHGPFLLEYEYFHRNSGKVDVANPCSVLDKFVCDALTELQCWPEDNVEYVKEVRYKFGGVDPLKQGYCLLRIYKI